MKKRPSLSAVSGRSCPHCLLIIDPVCYGWHLGKCSFKKLASTSKPDMAPQTPIKNAVAGNSCFRDDGAHVFSPREAPTFAPDSQICKEGVSGQLPSSGDKVLQSLVSSSEEINHLWEENRALKNDLMLKSEENEALNDKLKDLELKLEERTSKVKSLELKLEDLERRVKISEEVENKAACLLDSSHNISREKDAQGGDEGTHSRSTHASHVKAMGMVKGSGAGPEASNIQVCDKKEGVVDSVKEQGVAADSARSGDLDRKLDLDHIVDLACGECATPCEFLPRVERAIKDKEAIPSIVNTSRKQRILSGMLCRASNDNPCNTEFDVTNLQNEFPSKGEWLASHTPEPFQNAVSEEVPCMLSLPRAATGNQCFRESVIDTHCAINLRADGHGVAKAKGGISGMGSAYMMDVGAHGLAPLEMQCHGVGTSLHVDNPKTMPSLHIPLEGDAALNAEQIMKEQSHSRSASTEPEMHAVKVKSGFRRMVLPSDSESDSCNIQGIHSLTNTHEAPIPDSKKRALLVVSSDAEDEESNGFSEGFCMKSPCPSGKARQDHLQRSKRSNVVCISDQSDDAKCKADSAQRNHGNAEAAGIGLEGEGGDGNSDEEHAGVRRSKRLRKMSTQNLKGSLQKESMCAEKSSSSDDETSANLEEFEDSKSGTSASMHTEACKARVKRKRPSRTRKRLFEDVESRPLYGNKHSSDSEVDDSETESDVESLKDFITESEGIESSGYSRGHHSSSSSYSSREAYCDPKHKRGIKIRNYVWELEGEMLAMLATDPELCLRAVCALNRRQTEDEQKEKISKYANKRGFDKLHAARGSRLAEFLTDGDISGPVKKSVKDLKKFDAGGLKRCQMLASKHSKQLFEMYTNEEDPHFPYA